MPNYCQNKIIIQLNGETLEFGDTLFENHFPMPAHIYRGSLGEEERKLHGENNWYDWAWENWGTKWDPEIVDEEDIDGGLIIWASSAWAPPIQGILKLSELFPKAEFELEYSEQGCDFQGSLICQAGKILEHEESPYFSENPVQCPHCGSDQHPAIFMDGEWRDDHECDECGEYFSESDVKKVHC